MVAMTEEQYMEAVGRRLCEYRMAAGWSQEQAAREVDVSVSTWRAWETGRREPYPANWTRISEAFGVPVSALRELTDPDAMAAIIERLEKLEAQVADLLKRLK